VQLNYDQIYNSLRAFVAPGSVFELRMIGTRKGQIDSGYFNDPAIAANALVSARGYYKGVYFTPNPNSPDVLARSYNRISEWAQYTTNDTEITRRKWLLLDIDPKRPQGISSTDAEHAKAIAKARTIAGMMAITYGWCDPMINSSGNGAHLLYPMDEENTNEVRDAIHTLLQTLKAIYDDECTQLDVTVYNAARIWRLPGTWARKGDSTPERPHRQAQILQPLNHLSRLSILQIMRFNHENARILAAAKGRVGQTGVLAGVSKSRSEYPQEEAKYKRLNDAAMGRVREWVPHFFPTAREYKEGYRVASADIGQDYEEELTIHPWPLGIKYFGNADEGDKTEGRRTPIGVIAEYSLHCDKDQAARVLADRLKYPLTEFENLPLPPAAPMGATMESLLGAKQKYSFKSIRSIADLQKATFKEVKWIVEGVIPTGNMLLAARPKMRKTWLALQLGIAVTSGRKFLDWQCNPSEVLFLGLEDNERRMQNRIKTLQKFEMFPPDLSGFRYWTGGMDYDGAGRLRLANPEEAAATLAAFPRGEAGVDALEQYLEEYPLTKMIIVDTFAHFRGARTSRDVYQSDYDAMTPLTKLAGRKGVLILSVMHEKKGLAADGAGADFLEDVTGSAGITGGSDGVISIKGRRGVQEENESRELYISGRDVPFDYKVDISFDAETGGWRKAAREDTRIAIRGKLTAHPFLNQKDLAALLPNTSLARLTRCLLEMKMEGEVQQGKYGYSLSR
jgi:hypothetical protein